MAKKTYRTGTRIPIENEVFRDMIIELEQKFPKGYKIIKVSAEMFDLSEKVGIAFEAEGIYGKREIQR